MFVEQFEPQDKHILPLTCVRRILSDVLVTACTYKNSQFVYPFEPSKTGRV